VTEEQEHLLEEFEKARKELYANTKDGKQFHRFETLYGLAYRKLVNAGLKPKLRLKHRPMY